MSLRESRIQSLLDSCDKDFGQSNFGLSSYLNDQGKEQPAYSMTRDGFTLLAMGFTGHKALQWKIKYIEAFNAMEKHIATQGQQLVPRLADIETRLQKIETTHIYKSPVAHPEQITHEYLLRCQ